MNDESYIAGNQELVNLLSKNWTDKIYKHTYKGITAAALVHGIFIHRRPADELCFLEVMSDHMTKNDAKIKSINVRIDPFKGSEEQSQSSLDDILLHSDYAINAFYQGHLGIELTRGRKERNVNVKTTLNKAIFLMKVFPYTETQTFYVVSPRKIIIATKLQMEKVFYSDHYYV